MADERDFCEYCGCIFGDGVSDSMCRFYDEKNHLKYICVTCFEENDGYNEFEQYNRQELFRKEIKIDQQEVTE